MRNRISIYDRRGISSVETVLLIVLVVCVALIAIGQLGSKVSKEFDTSASEIKQDRSFFKQMTGQASPDAREEYEGEAEEYETGKRKGNNGVGNGEDPQPPGNPPINDGPGTSPGDPGNRGGAHK